MKKILVALAFMVSILTAQAQISDTTSLRGYINSTIVPNTSKSITAQMLNNILNGQLNVLPGLLNRYYDSIWIAAGNLYVKKNGFTVNYSLIAAEIDPTVYSWAKASVKPSYTWSEIGGKPSLVLVSDTVGKWIGSGWFPSIVLKSTLINGYSLASNITLAKGDVGLGNVDNTSDVNKPVSTAQQTALNLKLNSSDSTLANRITADRLYTDALGATKQSQLNGTGLVRMSGTAVSYDANNYLTGNQTIAVSGDATGSGQTSIVVTLVTVNSNVGTYGSFVVIPQITVDAKGRVTAISNTSIPTASGTQAGLLNATDWSAFNAKQAALGFTPENVANKAVDFNTLNNTLYPSVQAVKSFVDASLVSLVDDRGNWSASLNTFPTTGGSGTGGAVVKGDLYFISAAGVLGTDSIFVGDQIRALVDLPGQTVSNWAVLRGKIPFTPENIIHKSDNISLGYSSVLYPTQNAVKVYVDGSLTNYYTVTQIQNFFSGASAITGYNNANWNTAFSQTRQWDGGATGLASATGRASLGLGSAALNNSGDFLAAGGTAVNSTLWNSAAYGGAQTNAITYMMSYDAISAIWHYTDASKIQTFLNLGTAAYTATSAYVPSSGYTFGIPFSLGTMFDGTSAQAIPTQLLGSYSNGYIYHFGLNDLKSWFGLGSNAYSSTAYLPLIAGAGSPLTGDVFVQPNAASNNVGVFIQNNNTGGWGSSIALGLYGYNTSFYFNPLRIESSYPGYGLVNFYVKGQSNSTEISALNINGLTGAVKSYSNLIAGTALGISGTNVVIQKQSGFDAFELLGSLGWISRFNNDKTVEFSNSVKATAFQIGTSSAWATLGFDGTNINVNYPIASNSGIFATTAKLSTAYSPYTYNDQFEINNETVWRLRFQAHHNGSGYDYRIVQNNNGADVNVMEFINGSITVEQAATFNASVTASSFTGLATGIIGTASGLTAGLLTIPNFTSGGIFPLTWTDGGNKAYYTSGININTTTNTITSNISGNAASANYWGNQGQTYNYSTTSSINSYMMAFSSDGNWHTATAQTIATFLSGYSMNISGNATSATNVFQKMNPVSSTTYRILLGNGTNANDSVYNISALYWNNITSTIQGANISGNAATATALTNMNISQFTNDAAYITNGTSTLTNYYTATQVQNFFSGASAITGYNYSNWNTAYGWGNHASAGYATASNTMTFTNKTWNGAAIANAYLANSAITINGTPVSLGGSITISSSSVSVAASGVINNSTTIPSANFFSYTNGASDRSIMWHLTVNVSSYTSGTLSFNVHYTDVTNTARTYSFYVSQAGEAILGDIPLRIKAGTTVTSDVTWFTSGTATFYASASIVDLGY